MAQTRTRAGLGFIAAALISAVARRYQALSPGGAFAATAVGGLTVAGAGFRGGAALVAFFVSSSLLGRLPGANLSPQRRGNEREAVQVLANGGVASALATASILAPASARRPLLAGFGGALAAAAADTWATEIGSRSRQTARSIVSARPVSTGASGGVTWAGLAASAAGAAMIAGVAAAGEAHNRARSRSLLVAITFGGITGALLDSILGATVQEVRFCETCRQETELHRHCRGRLTRRARGVSWCDNDTVNAFATAAGAATAIAVIGLAPVSRDA